ncbi:MAG: response regulator [Thermoflexaceae bacterium]|nr:response regulator [Thermoflexaceae bacterium]
MAYTFLLVDGAASAAERAEKLLALAGPGGEVLRASSGPAAIAQLDDLPVPPSLVFVDFQMPGMNVIEFLAAIRMRNALQGLPVAVCATSIADREVVSCYRLGVCAVLLEPLSRHDLQAVIAEWARPSRRHPRAASLTRPGPDERRHVA